MPVDKLESPYKGLVPFEEADAPLFFGREKETRLIIANIFAAPLTLLYGASGVGKTSVLQAGVARQLRMRDDVIAVVFKTWQGDPVINLKSAIAEEVIRTTGIEVAPESRFLADYLEACVSKVNRSLIIILDQFEDYFLYHPQDSAWTAEFAETVTRSGLEVSFLISIREDAYAKLDRFEGHVPNLFENFLRIDHLDRSGARAAIKKPIEHLNKALRSAGEAEITIEENLVEAVLDQTEAGQLVPETAGRGSVVSDKASGPTEFLIEAPYLQLVMTRLWNEEVAAGSRTLRLTTLEHLGKAERIVKSHLDSMMGFLRPGEQEIASKVFHFLVTPSGTKITHTVSDLAKYAKVAEERASDLLRKLSGTRFRVVRAVSAPLNQPEVERYEVFHDVLAPAILDWRARYVQGREAELFFKEKLRKYSLPFVVVLLSIAVAVIVYVLHLREIADDKGKIALSRQLAAQALHKLDEQLDLSLLLSVEALRASETPEAKYSLISGLEKNPPLSSYLSGNTLLKTPVALAFSNEGQTLVSGGSDGSVYRWDLASLRPIGPPFEKLKDSVQSLVLSSDGRTLAVGSSDGSIVICDVGNPESCTRLDKKDGSPFTSLALSHDGKTLASSNSKGTIILWDVKTYEGKELPANGNSASITCLSLNRDGTILAAVAIDGRVRLWDVDTEESRGEIPMEAKSYAETIAFSVDGKTLAVGTADGRITFWGVETQQYKGEILPERKLNRGALTFSANDSTLAMGSKEGVVILWDVDTRQRKGGPLNTEKGEVTTLAFSPDGQTLAAGSVDSRDRTGRVWLWHVDTGESRDQPLIEPELNRLVFSLDGKTLATTSSDGSVTLWDVDTRQRKGNLLPEPDFDVKSLALNRDGTTLAIGSGDGWVSLWEVASWRCTARINMQERIFVEELAFSPDGKTLAIGTADGKVSLWDAASRQPTAKIDKLGDFFYASFAFSPDGKTLAIGGYGKVILRDVASRQRPKDIHMIVDIFVVSLAFSPDGKVLALGSDDGKMALWDIDEQHPLTPLLPGYKGYVESLAFSPEGRTLISMGEGNTIIKRDFDLDLETLTSRACRIANRNLSEWEWDQYVKNGEPRSTCVELPP